MLHLSKNVKNVILIGPESHFSDSLEASVPL